MCKGLAHGISSLCATKPRVFSDRKYAGTLKLTPTQRDNMVDRLGKPKELKPEPPSKPGKKLTHDQEEQLLEKLTRPLERVEKEREANPVVIHVCSLNVCFRHAMCSPPQLACTARLVEIRATSCQGTRRATVASICTGAASGGSSLRKLQYQQAAISTVRN